MNFLHDKHSRYYCIFIVTLVLLLFLMGIAVIDTQTAATKEMFLTHNNAIATSLLEEGISKEQVVYNTSLILSHLSVNECENIVISVLPTEGHIVMKE